MTAGEDTDRWFVTMINGSTEDVGAYCLMIKDNALLFQDPRGKIIFAYAPGTWKFVEYQD